MPISMQFPNLPEWAPARDPVAELNQSLQAANKTMQQAVAERKARNMQKAQQLLVQRMQSDPGFASRIGQNVGLVFPALTPQAQSGLIETMYEQSAQDARDQAKLQAQTQKKKTALPALKPTADMIKALRTGTPDEVQATIDMMEGMGYPLASGAKDRFLSSAQVRDIEGKKVPSVTRLEGVGSVVSGIGRNQRFVPAKATRRLRTALPITDAEGRVIDQVVVEYPEGTQAPTDVNNLPPDASVISQPTFEGRAKMDEAKREAERMARESEVEQKAQSKAQEMNEKALTKRAENWVDQGMLKQIEARHLGDLDAGMYKQLEADPNLTPRQKMNLRNTRGISSVYSFMHTLDTSVVRPSELALIQTALPKINVDGTKLDQLKNEFMAYWNGTTTSLSEDAQAVMDMIASMKWDNIKRDMATRVEDMIVSELMSVPNPEQVYVGHLLSTVKGSAYLFGNADMRERVATNIKHRAQQMRMEQQVPANVNPTVPQPNLRGNLGQIPVAAPASDTATFTGPKAVTIDEFKDAFGGGQ